MMFYSCDDGPPKNTVQGVRGKLRCGSLQNEIAEIDLHLQEASCQDLTNGSASPLAGYYFESVEAYLLANSTESPKLASIHGCFHL